MSSEAYKKIYGVVRKIPQGRVMTYGGVASKAGLPGRARQVGYALHALPEGEEGVPWQRVVNAQGRISLPDWEGAGALQRSLLESEGVVFGEGDRIDLATFGWPGK
ncbi:MAG: MGMT family protein [Myxococcota bacterium]|nr:MGMT family protein [Myxococcota bacterium]